MRREVLPMRSKAFLVTFAVIGKSNCLPRHERQANSFLHLSNCKSSCLPPHKRQANSFLLISKSSYNLQHEWQAKNFLHLSNCKSSCLPPHKRQAKNFLLISKSSINLQLKKLKLSICEPELNLFNIVLQSSYLNLWCTEVILQLPWPREYLSGNI
jgi:hypothetical protein